MRKLGVSLAAAALMASTAFGVSYTEIVTWNQLKGTLTGSSHYAAAVEGDTSYHTISLNNGGGITKVENISGVQTTTTLLDTATWFTATSASGGETNISSFYGFGVSGDYVQFGDSNSDAVWRVHKATGALTEYVSAAQIVAYTGGSASQLLSSAGQSPDGEYTFYEGSTDSILKTTGAGTLTTVASSLDLTTALTTDSVSGGMTYDAAGNLLFASNSIDSMWQVDTGGTISQVLATAEITAVTGGTSAGFGDIFYAPDGKVYFYETSADSILSFDPADPAGTLAFVINEADLIAGPMASDNVVSLTWYDGNLAFHRFNDYGLYVLPEPSSLLLLGLAGLLIRRR